MSDILEKSLDDIIGESKSSSSGRRFPPRRGRGGPINRRGGGPGQYRRLPTGARIHKPHSPPYHHPLTKSINSTLPRDIAALAGPRPVLRVKNVHPDLNGEDLSQLFGSINDVDFVKFDAVNDSIAYVCFQKDCVISNSEAIQKYDGKKAMGKILVVENAISLADRIKSLPVRERGAGDMADRVGSGSGGRGGYRGKHIKKGRGGRFGRHVEKSAEELDKELSDYMNTDTNEDGRESSVNDEINME